MYRIEINTINPEANEKFFGEWLKENYNHYSGFIRGNDIIIYFISEPSLQEKTDIETFYNSITESQCLVIYKSKKITEIKTKTDYLILTNGYSYEISPGVFKTFPLIRDINGVESTNPQTNILALHTSKNELTYPINFNTIDHLYLFSCLDSATIEQMYLTALETKKSYLDGETALITQVRDCLTKAEIDSIIDNR